jgi:hypothetical protein
VLDGSRWNGSPNTVIFSILPYTVFIFTIYGFCGGVIVVKILKIYNYFVGIHFVRGKRRFSE